MSDSTKAAPIAILAEAAPPRVKPSNYPEPFFSRMAKREKRPHPRDDIQAELGADGKWRFTHKDGLPY